MRKLKPVSPCIGSNRIRQNLRYDEVTEPAEDPTQALFPADRAIVVEVTMDPDHWDALRAQTRTIIDILGPACGEGPYESPFTYFPATVTVEVRP